MSKLFYFTCNHDIR